MTIHHHSENVCIHFCCSWRCCMCQMSNEVPQLFDWDQARNQPGDRWARPELNHGVVEFIAPTEYMVRPPQPPVYIFLIDVSHGAIQSGELQCIASSPSRANRSCRNGRHCYSYDLGVSGPSTQRRPENKSCHRRFRCVAVLLLHACTLVSFSPFNLMF